MHVCLRVANNTTPYLQPNLSMYVGKTQLFISGLHTRSFLTSLSKTFALTKFNTIAMPLFEFAQPEDNVCVAFRYWFNYIWLQYNCTKYIDVIYNKVIYREYWVLVYTINVYVIGTELENDVFCYTACSQKMTRKEFANKLFNTIYYEIKILTLNLIFTPYCYDRLCFNLQATNSYSTFI